MKIETIQISKIKLNPNNPRLIKDDKFTKLVQSIKDFPEMLNIRPIVVNEDMIILGGNMRFKACKEAGLKEVPIIKASGLSAEKQREFLIKDNVSGGEWDFELLKDWDALELESWGLDLPAEFVTELEAEEDEFDVPENGIETDIVLGDLFEIGEHRLLCGDSTDSDAVAKLMNGEKADIGFTSPPYNSGGADFTYDYKAKKEGGFYENYKDDLTSKEYFEFLISVLNNYYLNLNEESHSLFWNVMYNANSRSDYGKIIFSEQNPLSIRETIIWNKLNGFPVAGDNILSRNTELIFLLSNSQKYRTNQNNRTIYWNRWDISNQGSQDSKNKHKACFPLELPFKAIQDFSKDNDIILDLFCGSGTTMVASHQLKRKCYGMELDPKYCQVIIDRMLKIDPTIKIKKNGLDYNK